MSLRLRIFVDVRDYDIVFKDLELSVGCLRILRRDVDSRYTNIYIYIYILPALITRLPFNHGSDEACIHYKNKLVHMPITNSLYSSFRRIGVICALRNLTKKRRTRLESN